LVTGFVITNLQTGAALNQYPGSRNIDDPEQEKLLIKIKIDNKNLV